MDISSFNDTNPINIMAEQQGVVEPFYRSKWSLINFDLSSNLKGQLNICDATTKLYQRHPCVLHTSICGTSIDYSSLKSINAGMGSLGNSCAEFMRAGSPVAERLIQNTALRLWRPGGAGGWISNLMATLKLCESREMYIYESSLGSREIFV